MSEEITIALGIPHCPWLPERVESMKRLRVRAELGVGTRLIESREFSDREKNHEWSERMWKWGAETKATHFLTLQDDAIVAPNFWGALGAMLTAVPDEVICLEVVHPATRALAVEGHRWFTTADMLIGVGYVLPSVLLREFLEWRATALKPGALEAINEDTLLALWCVCTRRKIWHPIPTIVDHDTTLPSTYGNDHHQDRRPLVTWASDHWRQVDEGEDEIDEDVITYSEHWQLVDKDGEPSVPPHLGRFWNLPALGLEWVKDYPREAYLQAMRDTGRDEVRRLARAMRASRGESYERIMVCTPNHGSTSPDYNLSIWKVVGADELEIVRAAEIEEIAQQSTDVVRARSRFVRTFLESDCTRLWFLDADVSCDPVVLRGMLAVGRDIVAAPYPKREQIDLARVRKLGEAAAYSYAIRFPKDWDRTLRIDAQDCVEVAGMPLGCALISRACLEAMVKHYAAPPPVDIEDLYEDGFTELKRRLRAAVDRGRQAGPGLEFDDTVGASKFPTTALFLLPIDNRELLSEDLAFCARWRAMGGKVWMYLGPGSPVTHHGVHAFRGNVGAFGLRRVEV